jgi:predicted DNA binding CopG/RHH family protein
MLNDEIEKENQIKREKNNSSQSGLNYQTQIKKL